MKSALLIVAALLVAMTAPVQGQTPETKARLAKLKPADFPSRAIQINVGTPAGGGMDLTARLLARKFTDYTDQPVIVHNRPGAGGMINNEWVIMHASKDGYQIGMLNNAIIADTLLRTKGKWSYRDLDNLAFINFEPVMWLTSTSGRFGDKPLKEVLQAAKQNPNTLRVASVPDTLFEMLAEQVEATVGTSFIKVPYQGGGQAMAAVVGDHIDVAYGFFSEFQSFADRVKAVAVAGAQPVAHLPGVPTFNQVLGTDDIQWVIWRYLGAPKGIPEDRRTWLVAALNAVLSDGELVAEYRKRGSVMDREGLDTPEGVTKGLEELAAAERSFYQRTGRMKP